jgi:hypothetical protein
MTDAFDDLFIIPEFDDAAATVQFTAPAGSGCARWAVMDGERAVAEGELTPEPASPCTFGLELPGFTPWSVRAPHLYALRMTIEMPDGERAIEKPFGMRKIHVEGDQVFVNNEPFYVRGVIRGREAHDHPNLMDLPEEEYYAKYIREAKAFGFNFIRFHSRIPPKACFRVADRLGIFLHVEIRKYFGKYQKERSMINDAGELVDEQQWREAILAHRNHPSLMVWCLGNEIRHPGTNPRVEYLRNVCKELDPTRLFLDTCAHGEFDRTYVDLDVQHMSYFFPFGRHYDMFENTYNWFVYGSCKGTPLIESDPRDRWELTRAFSHGHRPVLAHEICHYVSYRDIDALDEKFTARCPDAKPWWIDELKNLRKDKGFQKDYRKCLSASRHWQAVCWKLGIEAARRSPILAGFHFLQLADTERYENANGILDCFDDRKDTPPEAFLPFNADSVLLADLPRRTYFEGEEVTVPVQISHFDPAIRGQATLRFVLQRASSGKPLLEGQLEQIDLDELGLREIARLHLRLPETQRHRKLKLKLSLLDETGEERLGNDWPIWVFANRPDELPKLSCTVALDEVNPMVRYPQISHTGSLKNPKKLLLTNRFTKEVFKHLDKGGDVLMLYRVPETRDRLARAEREKYRLPTSWDRLKGVIWDRGTNCGGFTRKHKLWKEFPQDGLLDLQFHGLVDDCDKIILDDFPATVKPILQGVDKAVRDRFDVYTFGLSELQPGWTMRTFGYLLELRVGKGRLLLTGLNFTRLGQDCPEVCAMFDALLRYVTGKDFLPETKIGVDELRDYLKSRGKQPLPKERRMTQYWQLDNEPLESERYWQESEAYLREDMPEEEAPSDGSETISREPQ